MIKVYGHPMSTCTRKVLTTLAETNTPYELTVVDFAKGEHKQQPHMSRQPFGQVPSIEDNGFELYESRAQQSRRVVEPHQRSPELEKSHRPGVSTARG